jgi:hypothetical protein
MLFVFPFCYFRGFVLMDYFSHFFDKYLTG